MINAVVCGLLIYWYKSYHDSSKRLSHNQFICKTVVVSLLKTCKTFFLNHDSLETPSHNQTICRIVFNRIIGCLFVICF